MSFEYQDKPKIFEAILKDVTSLLVSLFVFWLVFGGDAIPYTDRVGDVLLEDSAGSIYLDSSDMSVPNVRWLNITSVADHQFCFWKYFRPQIFPWGNFSLENFTLKDFSHFFFLFFFLNLFCL